MRQRAKHLAQWQELPEDQRRAMFAALHEQTAASRAFTREQATHAGERWTMEEDAYLLSHHTGHQVALDLGRSAGAVSTRRYGLRRGAKRHQEQSRE